MIERTSSMRRHGFSLIEMSMVIVLSGFMASYILMSNHSSGPEDCYAATKVEMPIIRAALDRFAQKNDRLPLPSSRSAGVEDPNYGNEGGGDVRGASTWGAVPFQVLGLSPSYGADCWGNKFTYVVTTALTNPSAVGGYLDPAVPGAITLMSSGANTVNTNTAYAVISDGEDGLGAVKANATSAGWCTAGYLRTINCSANSATVADAVFNDGKDAGGSYFDDVVITGGHFSKATNVNALGDNTNGQLGDGTTTARSTPTPVSGGITFKQMAVDYYDSCGINLTGTAYCWGDNSRGELGDGTTTSRLTPTPVAGGHAFKQISTRYYNTCAIDTAGQAWCWGFNYYGESGNGVSTGQHSIPTAVAGSHAFTQIDVGFYSVCAIDTAGQAWCWGYNSAGQLGNGSSDAFANHYTPTAVLGSHVFTQISVGVQNACAIDSAGAGWCWGYNDHGEGGDGSTTTMHTAPVAVYGAHVFKQIQSAALSGCGLDTMGKAWCWGENTYGQIGMGTVDGADHLVPTAEASGRIYKQLSGFYYDMCGLTATGAVYCWGDGAGDTGNTGVYLPNATLVPTGGVTFSQVFGDSEYTLMGILGTPP